MRKSDTNLQEFDFVGELHVVIPVQDYNDGNDDVDDERKIVIEFQAIILFIYIYIYVFFASFFFFLVPVFGAELGFQFRPAERPAPIVVMKCIQALDKGGLQTLGIHSIIPTGSEKNALRTALNQSNNH